MKRQDDNPDGRVLQEGFALIELMIALLLGAIILLGVTEIVTNTSRTRNALEQTGRQIEAAGYALRVMESDISNAGYWGEASEQNLPAAGIPPMCAGVDGDDSDMGIAETNLLRAMAYPIQAQDPNASASAEDESLCISPAPKANTDFFAVRRASSCATGETDCPTDANNYYLQVNACFTPDDSSQPVPGDIRVKKRDDSALDYEMRDCSTTAPRYQFLNRIYYINANDQLVRWDLDRSATGNAVVTPLVDGVETMQIEYGLDSTGDGQVNRIIPSATDTSTPQDDDWANVVMVRVTLVVRNPDSSAGFTDTRVYNVAGEAYTVPSAFINHRREVYSRTISVFNVSGRRE